MINLYIQMNVLVAAAWLFYQLLPNKRFSFRARKVIAQTLLLSALATSPVLAVLPDVSFFKFSEPLILKNGRDADGREHESSSVPRVFSRAAVVAEKSPSNIHDRGSIWMFLFFAGMATVFIRLALGFQRLRVLLRKALVLHDIGRTTIALSDSISVPFSVLMPGRAYVVLPTELVPHRKDFRIALRHEIEHHRRRDTLWAILLEVLMCGFYVNPFVYLWRNTILKLQELACDEALISRMGISARAYGSCLLRVAEMALDCRVMHAGTTCMIPTSESNSHSFLRRRIKMFVQHERSSASKSMAVAMGALAGLAIFAGAYVAQAAMRPGGEGRAHPGKPVFDTRIQASAEEILKKGMVKHGASAGFAIVADPMRGTIIAAASLNEGFDDKLKGDWSLSYPLEPGSALKPLIAASAIQHGATTANEMHNCEKGEYKLGKMLVRDVESYEKLSTADAVIHSSNICTLKIGQTLGAKGVENALREFGLGNGVSVNEFPSATSGHVPVAGVIPEDNYIALVSQGISNRTDFYVTPLELVQAYGAMANGGRLMKSIGINEKLSSGMVRNVLSPEVSAQMRDILKRVVTEGTATGIKVSSLALAGKTSTVISGDQRRITGFIGFAPADRPKLLVYVALFDPKGKNKFGSNTAAPVFREIIEKALPAFQP